MELIESSLQNKEFWAERNIAIPEFDHAAMMAKTKAEPKWAHFGPGNIFRAFIANLQQSLLNQGLVDYGVIAVETNFPEMIDVVYKAHDNLSVLVTMNPDQSMEKTVVGSVGEALSAIPGTTDWQRLQEIFRNPSLAMVSFTVTEKGYQLKSTDGSYTAQAEADFAAGPAQPTLFPAKLTALLYDRYLAGELPCTMVSMDNCSHNGAVVQASLTDVAAHWEKQGLVKAGFCAYMQEKLSYPWSMIDKITPRPAPNVQASLEADDLDHIGVIKNSSGGFFAPFVNAEKTQYLVIEDDFKNGRPPLEKAGVIFTTRETVEKVERMKVCTCLNPLHTCLAVYGCVLGHTLIADEMRDAELAKLVEKIGAEGMPVVTDPGVLSPTDFINQCLQVRFPNPAIPDTPQRIACDTSQKVGIRYGETIKAYGAKAGELNFIPLAIAGWLRYLLAVDDKGQAFELSPDPLLAELRAALKDVQLGAVNDVHAACQPILSNAKIFGSDLYATALASKVEGYLTEMLAGPGAVRATLQKYVK